MLLCALCLWENDMRRRKEPTTNKRRPFLFFSSIPRRGTKNISNKFPHMQKKKDSGEWDYSPWATLFFHNLSRCFLRSCKSISKDAFPNKKLQTNDYWRWWSNKLTKRVHNMISSHNKNKWFFYPNLCIHEFFHEILKKYVNLTTKLDNHAWKGFQITTRGKQVYPTMCLL